MAKATKKKKQRTLVDYVKFLKEKHVDDFVRMQTEMIYKEDIPLLKFVPLIPEKERIENSRKNLVNDFFDPIINGDYMERVTVRMKVWEDDKLAYNISQTDITPIDVVVIYAVQQKLLLHFLPEFTKDNEELIAIIGKIHDYFTDLRKAVFNTYTHIQHATERAIRESEETFRLMTENVKDYAIFKLDPDGNIITWNKGAERIKGCTAEEVIGKNYAVFFTKEQIRHKDPERNLKSAIKNGRFETEDWRVRKDHSLFWAHVVVTPIYDSKENLKGFTKITHDATERKKAEEKITNTIEQLKQAQELAHFGSWELDLYTNEITWSDELYRIYGLKPQHIPIVYGEFWKYNFAEDRDYVNGVMAKAMENKKPFTFEYRIVNANGYLRVLHTHGEVFTDKKGKPIKMAGTVQDITERKIAEEQLLKTNRALSEAQHLAHIGSWEYDVKTGTRLWSDELYHIYGFKRSEVKWSIEDFRKYTIDEDKNLHKEMQETIFKEKEPFVYEYRIKNKKGELRYLQTRGIVITDDSDNPIKITGTTQDITEQKLAEEKIKESREQFKLLVNAQSEMGEGVSITEGSRFVYANEALCEIYGYTRDELYSMESFYDMIPPREKEKLVDKTNRRLAGEKVSESGETSIRRKDGKIIQIEYSRKLLSTGKPNHFVSIIRDITERKKEEEKMEKTLQQLSEAQSLAHIGNWEWDMINNTVTFSDEIKRIYGMTKNEIGPVSNVFLKYVHPDDKDIATNAMEEAKKHKENFDFIYRIVRPDGNVRILDAHGIVITNKDGKVIKITGTSQDITERKKAEEEREQLISMLESTTDFVGYADANTTIIQYANKAGRKMIGIGKNEDITRFKINDVHPEWTNKLLLEVGMPTAISNGVWKGEVAFLHRDGQEIPVSMVLLAHKDSSGELKMFSTISRDIRHEKETEEKVKKINKELSEAQHLAHLGNWEWDINTDIVSWSDELYKIFGVDKEEIGGGYKGYLLNVHPDDTEMVKRILSKAKRDKHPFIVDYRIIHTNGNIRNVNARGVVITDKQGNAIKIAGTVQDTTEMIQVKRDLEVAQEMVKAKQQFLANMSHEIRTPMNVIIGFTKVILKTELTPKQKEYLEGIKISGETLLVLINDILDLAKVDAGKMVFEHIPFKLNSSINAILHLFEGKIYEKNLGLIKEFDTNLPNVIVGDPVRLHQIIMNLISNAVKFTHKGQIKISVHLLEENDEEATIEFKVTDTGIGIEEDQQKVIFEKFQQATSSTARLFGGTGLGLAIVKQLVEAQGGTVNLKSERGVGSEFSFIITFKKGELKEEIEVFEQEISESEIKSKTILVVEDMPFNQLLIRTLLNEMGFNHEMADNGQIAIDKLMENNHYDLILMDMQMPEMNGIEATDYIRNSMPPPVSQIPIIALTADVATMNIEKCKEMGMNDYISKPINEKLLYKKIVNLFIKPQNQDINQVKTVNLNYLKEYTKGDKEVMMQIIKLYLEQTTPVLTKMKESINNKDWDQLYNSIHKLIPSFSIIGIHPDYENTARKIQDYARTQENLHELPAMVSKIEAVCLKACEELEKLSLEI